MVESTNAAWAYLLTPIAVALGVQMVLGLLWPKTSGGEATAQAKKASKASALVDARPAAGHSADVLGAAAEPGGMPLAEGALAGALAVFNPRVVQSLGPKGSAAPARKVTGIEAAHGKNAELQQAPPAQVEAPAGEGELALEGVPQGFSLAEYSRRED